MSDPNHWYTHNCEFCFTETRIHFMEERPDPVYCPHCGTAVEEPDELDFDV